MVAHDVALSATEHVTVAVGRLSITIVAFVAVIVTSLFVDILHVITTIFEREKLGIESKVCLLPIKPKHRKHKKKKRSKSSSKSKSSKFSSARKKPERSTQSTVSGNPEKSDRFLKSVPSDSKKDSKPVDFTVAPPTLKVPDVVKERDKKQADFDNPHEPFVPNAFPGRSPTRNQDSTSLRIQQHANQYQAKRRTAESVLSKPELYKTNKISQGKPTPTSSTQSTFDPSKIPEATTPPQRSPLKVGEKPGEKEKGKAKSPAKAELSANMNSEGL